MVSTSTEEYLEALYNLSRGNKPVSTSAISKRLKIAPASVTEMLRKLAEKGYVNYSPYQGVTLKPKGYHTAEKITRKHRLLERFLSDVLKINKNIVHKEACEMEHALSDETSRAMCQLLNSPYICPDDGQFIPPCDFDFASCDECRQRGQDSPQKISKRKSPIVPISDFKENQSGEIAFIRGDNAFLRKLMNSGFKPGTKVKVKKAASSGGLKEIVGQGATLPLDDSVALNVFIKKMKN